ncbi:DnaJ-domain-containing protein [Hyphopichia burtonii NRRL Y-1933]|uniref:DnaJ-domain-containing protein n=1 Tax=Hyphopichia burtonii NRRL Y-1933 TaxID=984485 RepID=A0A1E4RN46_9ASCO|nr:DnaJ-domain-containing protein [Hyphopichia burtonii NRRL Y-1933]ODV68694.1 DnaJ-domain-containing protein [Hyphopichia burtonii NRRL Y-1933]
MKLFILLAFLVLFSILAPLIAALNGDPYQILEIGKDADEKTIKSAYRRLLKKYHPDKNPLEEAHEKFIEIGEAYEILSDETKKSNYDKYGDPEGAGGPGGGDFDFGDILNQFFGGGGGGPGGGRRRRGKPKGSNTQVNLHIALADFYRGKEVDFTVEMTNLCDECKGSGSEDGAKHTCDRCQGSGQILIQRQFGPGMVQRMQMQCDECGGSGNHITHVCKHCGGVGTMQKSRNYSVFVKAGTLRNDDIVLEGEGDQNPEWIPGDLIVKLKEDLTKSWGYRRIKEHLYRTEVLSLREAANGGWKRSIAFFGEDDIKISRKSGDVVIDGQVEVIKGKGAPIINEDDEERYGDLYIEYRVVGLQKKVGKDEL